MSQPAVEPITTSPRLTGDQKRAFFAAWGGWLKVRLGGMTGDCLGAGVEVTESALLLLVALTSGAAASLL